MRRFVVAFAFVVGCMAMAVPAGAQATADSQGGGSSGSAVVPAANPVPEQYIVTVRTPPAASGVAAGALTARHGGRVVRTYSSALAGYTARMTAAQAEDLSRDPAVASVEQDGIVNASATQNPAPSWGLDRIDQRDLPLDNAYTSATGAAGVTAYVIDTGIRRTNADFGGRASAIGFDAIGDGQNGNDCNGHGTHVAGTIGGTVYGVAKQVALVPVRVLACNGSGTYSQVIAGIDWVTANHAPNAVANMSLGGGASSALDTALANSVASGVTYAVAAGNSNADACTASPARAPSAITVGATTNTDVRASYSNYGTCVDLFAPGSSITSDWNTSDTATNTISGTSMASPHVAGSAALYLGDHSGASPATVTAALLGAATTGHVTSAGAGSPNLLDYVETAAAPPSPPVATVPAAPALTGTSGKRSAKLSWVAPNNGGSPLTGYRLTRATSPAGPFSLRSSLGPSTTSFSDNGLSGGVTYYYLLTALNSVGEGPPSLVVAVTPRK
jgi:subtilisin family serine protease